MFLIGRSYAATGKPTMVIPPQDTLVTELAVVTPRWKVVRAFYAPCPGVGFLVPPLGGLAAIMGKSHEENVDHDVKVGPCSHQGVDEDGKVGGGGMIVRKNYESLVPQIQMSASQEYSEEHSVF